MEKTIIVSSIPLHIAPGIGCAGVMLIREPVGTGKIAPESELKALHDTGGVDDKTNETNP